METEHQKTNPKKQIRSRLIHIRDQMAVEQAALCSKQICEHILHSAEFSHGKFFYMYHPLKNEANLLPIAKKALQMGKQIAFPKMVDDAIVFCQVHDLNELKPGRFQIMEPDLSKKVSWNYPIVFVPGVGFDKKYNRIGHGKGYYDRFFRSFNVCKKIGVGYDFQVIPHLPTEYFDISMDMLVTEYGLFS